MAAHAFHRDDATYAALATGDLPVIPVSGGGTGDTGTAWTPYTPTITASSGTLTTVSATGRWKSIGKTILVQLNIIITTNGTGAGAIQATLPAAPAANFVICGEEVLIAGKMLSGRILASSALIIIKNYDNSYPASDGVSFELSGVYEST